MKDQLYQVLNECTSVLNGQVLTGQANMYVTVDRVRFNALLKAITEAKKLLVMPEEGVRDSLKPDRRQETRRLHNRTENKLAEIYGDWEPSGE